MLHERVVIVQNIKFEMRLDFGCSTFETSRKVVLDNPSVSVCLCVSVCLPVGFAGAYPTNSHGCEG